MELELRLVSVSSIPHNYVFIHPHPSSGSRFPNLYFSGKFTGIYWKNATLHGSVSMGDDGVVRWRYVSLFFISQKDDILITDSLGSYV